MRDGNCVVITEVRYRSGRRLASARLTVDGRKQRKLVRTAAMFLSRRSHLATSPVRFDVVAIDVDADGKKHISWIRDAFRPVDSSL